MPKIHCTIILNCIFLQIKAISTATSDLKVLQAKSEMGDSEIVVARFVSFLLMILAQEKVLSSASICDDQFILSSDFGVLKDEDQTILKYPMERGKQYQVVSNLITPALTASCINMFLSQPKGLQRRTLAPLHFLQLETPSHV